jgi:ubiquinone biosynthesis protein
MDNINLWTNYANKVDYLVVPKVFEEFTNYNRNILALEFIESKPLSEISSDDKYQYCKNLIRSIFIGTFFYGIIHGDLHPGNVLFLENFTIGLIDFGIANKISKEEQEAIYKFYKIALIQKNVKDASLTIKNLVYPEENLNNLSEEESLSFYESVQEVIEKYFVNDPNIIKFIISLSFVVNKYNLSLSKGFSTTIYGISAGINLNLELMQPETDNPEREYNDLCISIIKELVNEIDFSLD